MTYSRTALIRLTRALGEVTPQSVRDFYRLAAEQIRRELLDLACRYAHRPIAPLPDGEAMDVGLDNSADLAKWTALQEAIPDLPVDLREVFGLTFYHDWKQDQIAELLQVSDRQVRRLWARACRRLHTAVGGELPSEQ